MRSQTEYVILVHIDDSKESNIDINNNRNSSHNKEEILNMIIYLRKHPMHSDTHSTALLQDFCVDLEKCPLQQILLREVKRNLNFYPASIFAQMFISMDFTMDSGPT